MRANRIVVTAPALDDDLRLAQRVEDLAIEQFVAQARIEALDKAVLPWAARRDVGGLRADGADLVSGVSFWYSNLRGPVINVRVGYEAALSVSNDDQLELLMSV